MTDRRSAHDHRRRRGVPDRLLLPPGPREPELARRWAQLPFEQRRALAHASTHPDPGAGRGRAPADGGGSAPDDPELVRALARARVATGWRLQVAALVFGWLMLMTLWGFGRSMFPEQEGALLAAGLLAGGVLWLGAGVAAARRVRRAREVAGGSEGDDEDA